MHGRRPCWSVPGWRRKARWLGEWTEQLGECCGKLTQLDISFSLLGLGLGALCLIDQVTVIDHGTFPRCS
jgi:hypothetical protein